MRRDSARADAGDPLTTLTLSFDELFKSSGLEQYLGRLVKRLSDTTGAYTARVTKLLPGTVATQAMQEGFRRRNVSLITNLRDTHVAEVSGILRAAASAGQRHEEIAPLIQERLKVGLSRAKLIARDQTTKLNGQLQRAHQEAAGITEYTWSTSKDENVREDHRALNGKRFKYSDPPVTNKRTGDRNNPGGDIQCRCVPIPVIPLFEGLQDPRPGVAPDPAPVATRPRPVRAPRLPVGLPAPGELRVNSQGLRPESFAFLRAGGAPTPALPVTVAYYPDRPGPVIVDGRHRISLARERGEAYVVGDIIRYGKRGGIVSRKRGVRIPI